MRNAQKNQSKSPLLRRISRSNFPWLIILGVFREEHISPSVMNMEGSVDEGREDHVPPESSREHRDRVAHEILETERTYVKQLEVATEVGAA